MYLISFGVPATPSCQIFFPACYYLNWCGVPGFDNFHIHPNGFFTSHLLNKNLLPSFILWRLPSVSIPGDMPSLLFIVQLLVRSTGPPSQQPKSDLCSTSRLSTVFGGCASPRGVAILLFFPLLHGACSASSLQPWRHMDRVSLDGVAIEICLF